jgi:hypothetical protein
MLTPVHKAQPRTQKLTSRINPNSSGTGRVVRPVPGFRVSGVVSHIPDLLRPLHGFQVSGSASHRGLPRS